MDLLNTEQYILMRKEAFRNDNINPTSTNAVDLLVWDTTRYTDFKKLLLGGTAVINDANLSVSGGNINTNFLLSGSYHRESTVLPTEIADHRGALQASINHSSADKNSNCNCPQLIRIHGIIYRQPMRRQVYHEFRT
jgi:hypothetical protein